MSAHRRHDISDHLWKKLEPHLPGRKGSWGAQAKNNRLFINAVFWIMRTACRSRLLLQKVQQQIVLRHANSIDSINTGYLLADRGYDTDAIREKITQQNMISVIPPKRNRRRQYGYDKYLYKMRHLAENAFLHLKRWRGIATRYAKDARSFPAIIRMRCIMLWANIS